MVLSIDDKLENLSKEELIAKVNDLEDQNKFFADIIVEQKYKRANLEKVLEQKKKDNLTGLYLKDEFEDMVKERGSFIYIDMDNFSHVNNYWGHDTGNKCLEEMGRIINSNIRNTDYAFRWGHGEEFLIYMPETKKDAASDVIKRIKAEMMSYDLFELPLEGDERQKVYFSASFGISSYEDGTEENKELINLADKRMYEDKSRFKQVRLVDIEKDHMKSYL